MSQNEFDQYSSEYNVLLNKALSGTGLDSRHFSRAKLKKLARLYPDLQTFAFDFLDFGCGTGNLYEAFADIFPKASYFGTDLSKAMIHEARSRFPEAEGFMEMDGDVWNEKSYNLILAAGVFHHIPHDDHKILLSRLYHLLAPGGRLVIWEHNPWNPFTQKIVNDCAFDKDAVLISATEMKDCLAGVTLSRPGVIYTTFFPKSLGFLAPLEPWLEWCPLGGQYLAFVERTGEAPSGTHQKRNRLNPSSRVIG